MTELKIVGPKDEERRHKFLLKLRHYHLQPVWSMDPLSLSEYYSMGGLFSL